MPALPRRGRASQEQVAGGSSEISARVRQVGALGAAGSELAATPIGGLSPGGQRLHSGRTTGGAARRRSGPSCETPLRLRPSGASRRSRPGKAGGKCRAVEDLGCDVRSYPFVEGPAGGPIQERIAVALWLIADCTGGASRAAAGVRWQRSLIRPAERARAPAISESSHGGADVTRGSSGPQASDMDRLCCSADDDTAVVLYSPIWTPPRASLRVVGTLGREPRTDGDRRDQWPRRASRAGCSRRH